MPLVFYYFSPSPPARSVDLVIHALGLSAEYKVLDALNKEQFKPEFLKLNPLHTIPLIIDDGFVLWESHAIMTYLVSKYGKDDSLYPKDLKKRAIVDQRLHYHNDVFYLLRIIIRKILFSDLRVLNDEQVQKVREAQINMEKLLEGNKFIAGDSLTVADYSFITLVDILEIYLPMGNKFPAMKAWIQRCKTTMKNFEHANRKGAEEIAAKIKEKFLPTYVPMEEKFPLIKGWTARCKQSMKNFEAVNKKGADDIVNKIKEGLSLFEHFKK